MSTTEEKPVASEATTQEESKEAKTHDVQYADDETTGKVRYHALNARIRAGRSSSLIGSVQAENCRVYGKMAKEFAWLTFDFLQVDLSGVAAVASGEEGLECIFKQRTKLYRFNDGQWKERGVGNLKLMRDRKERKIRVLMRQEKTYKPVANFLRKCPFPICEHHKLSMLSLQLLLRLAKSCRPSG